MFFYLFFTLLYTCFLKMTQSSKLAGLGNDSQLISAESKSQFILFQSWSHTIYHQYLIIHSCLDNLVTLDGHISVNGK